MVRVTFDRDLQRLLDQVLAMGSLVERALVDSVDILKRRDLEAAEQLVARDRHLNEMRFSIEADTLALIATQQPMAGDLRMLAAILEITTELERMGDYAKGIGKITLMIGEEPFIKPLVDIPLMAAKASDMLHRSLEAFVNQDLELARAIPIEDDEVDALYNQVYRELMSIIIIKPSTLDQANFLLWAAHNLERAGDRVTNICERVVFTVTGKMAELDTHFEVNAAAAAGE
ncbi:MAG: phosphate signaling complex protein PhoU [Anaerolineae bacterium]